MGKLNEEQLMQINNLMYYTGVTEKSNQDEIKVKDVCNRLLNENDIESGDPPRLQGGTTAEEARQIAKDILADEELRNMTITNPVDEGIFRAATIVDSDGNATVAF